MAEVTPRWEGSTPEADALARAYDRMAAEAASAFLRFERRFQTRLYVLEDGWLSLTDLDDDFHSMRVALRIAADGSIAEAAGRMLRNPYDACPRALSSLLGLVGASVARPSAHHQIKERIPRTEGCLHVVDMLTVAFRAFRIAKGHDIEPDYAGEETRARLLALLPNIRDTCVSFAVERDGGPFPG